VTRAFLTGISGQDASYLAERLLAEGVEVPALHHDVEAAPAHGPRQGGLHPGPRRLNSSGAPPVRSQPDRQ